jgi:hypothetical protein
MKKINLLLIALIFSGTLLAQNESGQKVVSLNFGYSLTGGVIKALGESEVSSDSFGIGSVDVTTLPAISLAFDYGVGEVFSIGLMYSFQSFSGEVKDYTWVDENFETRTESIDFGLTRNNIVLLPRFHYRLDNERFDLYSGLRLGYLFWGGSVESTDPNFDEFSSFAGGRPTFGLVPLGGRVYFTDNIGANFEVALGAPYIASVGAQYRF